MKVGRATAIKKVSSSFFYKKPSISIEIQQNYASVKKKSRDPKRRGKLSKTKNISKIEVFDRSNMTGNKSVMHNSVQQTSFSSKNSFGIRTGGSFFPHSKTRNTSPQVNKCSPRSMMNMKSKKILYKSFIKEFKLATERFGASLSKQDMRDILHEMHYLDSKSEQAVKETRYIDYLFRITKGLKENFKAILLCIESFYQFHYMHIQKENKQEFSAIKRTQRLPFQIQQSPQRTNESVGYKYQNSAKMSPTCRSPRSAVIKYDSSSKIIEIPEEYEDFIKRKFSTLCMNRNSKRNPGFKVSGKNSPISTRQELRSAKNLNFSSYLTIKSSKISTSNYEDKENIPKTSKNSIKRNVLKRISKTLLRPSSHEGRSKQLNKVRLVKKSTPQVNVVKVSRNFSNKNKNKCERKLFQEKQQIKPQIKSQGKPQYKPERKPLINHELSKKLKNHSLYSGDQKFRRVEVDLDSDSDSNARSNFLDQSVDKIEKKQQNYVANSMNSDETVLISATKNLNPSKQATGSMDISTASNEMSHAAEKPFNNMESLSTVPANTSHNTCEVDTEANPQLEPPQEEMLRLRDITNRTSHDPERELETDEDLPLQKYDPYVEELFLIEKYKDQKREILSKAKENKSSQHLEKIMEAENSEYESSTFDDRMQNSNIANPSIISTPCKNSCKYDYFTTEDPCCKPQPLLYIDVKISHDKTSRLVLYKNQTPVQAATEFIRAHNIPTKLRAYLICKVNAHYEQYIQKRND
ncbi:unnamed protein product [Moneuplotes crassus]|uniref:Uncharacterized protein n=1 Tax=Euplotes crassus TaxID=5936 RepID=A0AAD2DCZ1_EUPCR|nr:unnamed protein product [Moneuplotes crassus]